MNESKASLGLFWVVEQDDKGMILARVPEEEMEALRAHNAKFVEVTQVLTESGEVTLKTAEVTTEKEPIVGRTIGRLSNEELFSKLKNNPVNKNDYFGAWVSKDVWCSGETFMVNAKIVSWQHSFGLLIDGLTANDYKNLMSKCKRAKLPRIVMEVPHDDIGDSTPLVIWVDLHKRTTNIYHPDTATLLSPQMISLGVVPNFDLIKGLDFEKEFPYPNWTENCLFGKCLMIQSSSGVEWVEVFLVWCSGGEAKKLFPGIKNTTISELEMGYFLIEESQLGRVTPESSLVTAVSNVKVVNEVHRDTLLTRSFHNIRELYSWEETISKVYGGRILSKNDKLVVLDKEHPKKYQIINIVNNEEVMAIINKAGGHPSWL